MEDRGFARGTIRQATQPANSSTGWREANDCANADAQRRKSNMNYIGKTIVSIRESKAGQTMTEYVLIIAAIAVAGYIAYQGLEGGINTIITNVTATLKGA
jgi:Flp pilus assembly pilin Flp